MKVWSLAVGTAVALSACGRSGTTAGGTSVAGWEAPGDCQRVTIRLLGTNARDVASLRLRVDGVTATCSGEQTEADDAACGETLDLSGDGTVHDLGSFPFHRDGAHVAVSVRFSGGDACKGGRDGHLDGCLSPITFDLDPTRVDRARCHALILLDVGRSVVHDGDGLALLPNLRIVY